MNFEIHLYFPKLRNKYLIKKYILANINFRKFTYIIQLTFSNLGF